MPASIHQLHPGKKVKKVRPKSKQRLPRRLKILLGLFVTIVLVGVVQIGVVLWNSRQQEAQLERARETLRATEQQHKRLSIEINQLKDPEYLEKLIREKYLMSRSGELIFTLPDEGK